FECGEWVPEPAMHRAFAAPLGFPGYYDHYDGHNLDALNGCRASVDDARRAILTRPASPNNLPMESPPMLARLRFLLALVPIIVLALPVELPPGRADEVVHPEPTVNEPFDGKLRLAWKVVRADKKHWSLTKHKGKLTITTQKGSIHGADNPNVGKARNLFLIRNPYGRGTDFEVCVCVRDFKPTDFYHQAGLLLYDDDDNYLKFVWESRGKKDSTHLVLIRETAAKSAIEYVATPRNKGKVWLRLTWRKEKCEYTSSGDGKKWTVHGKV